MTTTVMTSSVRICDERRWAAVARTAARAESGSVWPATAVAVHHLARASPAAAVGERVWRRRSEPAAVERARTGITFIIIITGGRQRGKRFRLCRPCRLLRGDNRVRGGLVGGGSLIGRRVGKKSPFVFRRRASYAISCPVPSLSKQKWQLGDYSEPMHLSCRLRAGVSTRGLMHAVSAPALHPRAAE